MYAAAADLWLEQITHFIASITEFSNQIWPALEAIWGVPPLHLHPADDVTGVDSCDCGGQFSALIFWQDALYSFACLLLLLVACVYGTWLHTVRHNSCKLHVQLLTCGLQLAVGHIWLLKISYLSWRSRDCTLCEKEVSEAAEEERSATEAALNFVADAALATTHVQTLKGIEKGLVNVAWVLSSCWSLFDWAGAHTTTICQ